MIQKQLWKKGFLLTEETFGDVEPVEHNPQYLDRITIYTASLKEGCWNTGGRVEGEGGGRGGKYGDNPKLVMTGNSHLFLLRPSFARARKFSCFVLRVTTSLHYSFFLSGNPD